MSSSYDFRQNDQQNLRVLSIQSHVVSGYCGNKSAVFPLQTLGFDVDFVNSVQFSTHTGYPKWTGQVLNETDLFELFDGLEHNGLIGKYSHLLTGYARSPSFLIAMKQVIQKVKSSSDNVLYLCDPVMGDNGKMYVPEELHLLYKEQIIPLADIICPNQFEAQLLSGVEIVDSCSAMKAIDKLHSFGIQTVVISSTDDGFDGLHGQLTTIGSSMITNDNNDQRQVYKITVPRLAANFTGTGDLFSALFLAWFTKTGFNLKPTIEMVTSTLNSIIQRTYKHALKQPGGLDLAFNRELQIIQSRHDIQMPTVNFKAEKIELL